METVVIHTNNLFQLDRQLIDVEILSENPISLRFPVILSMPPLIEIKADVTSIVIPMYLMLRLNLHRLQNPRLPPVVYSSRRKRFLGQRYGRQNQKRWTNCVTNLTSSFMKGRRISYSKGLTIYT